MDGALIYGLTLSNETPDAKVLPATLKGTTFMGCNLDNVHIPEGCTVIGGTQRRFKTQNDGEDWIIDERTKAPVEPLNKKHFLKAGLSIDPRDIPTQKQDVSVLQKNVLEARK